MNKVERLFISKNIRVTAMRLLIYNLLESKKIAVALGDIEKAFDKSDRTTLYRTIKTFEENAIVHQIDDGTGIVKYALCKQGCKCQIEKDLHLHFRCNSCNQTICLLDYKIPPIQVPIGFVSEDINMVIKGICATCNV